MQVLTGKKQVLPYLFLSPAILFFIVFLFYPLILVFFQSFFHMNINKPYLDGFAGFANFRKLFSEDETFYKTLGISFRWVFFEVGLQLICGLAFALVLNQNFKSRSFFRTISFLPWAISGVLTAIMWSLMFNANIGVVNDLFLKLGLIGKPAAWLSDQNLAFVSVIVAELWRGIPFFTILILADLQQIPKEMYESASMDGAGRLKALFYITLPFLKDSLVLSSLLRVIWEFKHVDVILSLTGGGPANMTTTLAIYLTQVVMGGGDYGYGSAISAVVFFILLVFAVTYLKLSRFGGEK